MAKLVSQIIRQSSTTAKTRILNFIQLAYKYVNFWTNSFDEDGIIITLKYYVN